MSQRLIKLEPTLPWYAPQLVKPARYKILWGGRGGSKSWTFASLTIDKMLEKQRKILCTRELQSSIADSVHQLLVNMIDMRGLQEWFHVTDTAVRCHNGSEAIFKGLRHNTREIKSLEGIDIAWVEEAEKTSNASWEILIPTIRKEGSEIWGSLNPDLETDPTYIRFIKNRPPDSVVQYVSYVDNPNFPATLRAEMEYLKRVDFEAYLHVWAGHCRNFSDAQIFGKKYAVDTFTVVHDAKTGANTINGHAADGPYWGLDFGFAQDPTAFVKMWIAAGRLYIEHEIYRLKLETNDMPDELKKIQGADKAIIRADSARPETISYLNNIGKMNVLPADKWTGCVEDGISFIRQFEKVIIHERCKNAIMEARLYSFKTDRLTGDVLTDIVDKHNHIWDAVRYGLGPLIKRTGAGMGLFQVMAAAAAAKEQEKPK